MRRMLASNVGSEGSVIDYSAVSNLGVEYSTFRAYEGALEAYLLAIMDRNRIIRVVTTEFLLACFLFVVPIYVVIDPALLSFVLKSSEYLWAALTPLILSVPIILLVDMKLRVRAMRYANEDILRMFVLLTEGESVVDSLVGVPLAARELFKLRVRSAKYSSRSNVFFVKLLRAFNIDISGEAAWRNTGRMRMSREYDGDTQVGVVADSLFFSDRLAQSDEMAEQATRVSSDWEADGGSNSCANDESVKEMEDSVQYVVKSGDEDGEIAKLCDALRTSDGGGDKWHTLEQRVFKMVRQKSFDYGEVLKFLEVMLDVNPGSKLSAFISAMIYINMANTASGADKLRSYRKSLKFFERISPIDSYMYYREYGCALHAIAKVSAPDEARPFMDKSIIMLRKASRMASWKEDVQAKTSLADAYLFLAMMHDIDHKRSEYLDKAKGIYNELLTVHNLFIEARVGLFSVAIAEFLRIDSDDMFFPCFRNAFSILEDALGDVDSRKKVLSRAQESILSMLFSRDKDFYNDNVWDAFWGALDSAFPNLSDDFYVKVFKYAVMLFAVGNAKYKHRNGVDSILQKAERLALQVEAERPGCAAYNIACIASLRGQSEICRQWLLAARRRPRSVSAQHMRLDTDLDNVRSEPWFTAMLEEIEKTSLR